MTALAPWDFSLLHRHPTTDDNSGTDGTTTPHDGFRRQVSKGVCQPTFRQTTTRAPSQKTPFERLAAPPTAGATLNPDDSLPGRNFPPGRLDVKNEQTRLCPLFVLRTSNKKENNHQKPFRLRLPCLRRLPRSLPTLLGYFPLFRHNYRHANDTQADFGDVQSFCLLDDCT
jgi:hypothetical protein